MKKIAILTLAAILLATNHQTAFAATNSFNEKTIKQWTLKGPLTNCPARKTETLPLSDQENKSGWTKFDEVWDEFDGSALDTNKWTVGMAWWQGRQPAWFNPKPEQFSWKSATDKELIGGI